MLTTTTHARLLTTYFLLLTMYYSLSITDCCLLATGDWLLATGYWFLISDDLTLSMCYSHLLLDPYNVSLTTHNFTM